ncbi:hypothetical protein PG985_016279 [Apiospora marii]|uniref:Ecp2 effector protein-like domain-containing protein n=1 Tax=Apiospora marii TaxID=335849 RepID=A0ABR1SU08_9PEZI
MQIFEVLTSLGFLFGLFGLASANASPQVDAARYLNGADDHDDTHHWAPTITAAPAVSTTPPEILARASLKPVTVNPDLKYERIANTIPQAVCDTDNNNYENLTGHRGDGDGLVYDCQTLSGWLRDDANYGRFVVNGWNWDQTGERYLDLLWTDHCAFGAFRTDFQQEDLTIGGHDVADLIDVSVRHFSSPSLDPPVVEADGFLYCVIDIPVGWGLYNKFADEQGQWDVD